MVGRIVILKAHGRSRLVVEGRGEEGGHCGWTVVEKDARRRCDQFYGLCARLEGFRLYSELLRTRASGHFEHRSHKTYSHF